MRTHLRTALLLGLCLATTPALATDVLVWQLTATGFETTWLTVDGGTATPIAKRAEVVVSPDGTALWAIRTKTIERKVFACRDEDGNDLDETQTPGTVDWPGIAAVPLNGGAERWIADPRPTDDSDTIWGDVWSESYELKGGAGRLLMYYHVHTGYACGAHGFDESGGVVVDLTRAPVGGVDPASLLMDAAATGKEPIAALFDRATDEGCVDVGSLAWISLDGMGFGATGGAVEARLEYVYPTEAEWAFNCTIYETASVPTKALVADVRPSADVAAAVKALKANGTVGWSALALTGGAREAALKSFDAAVPAAAKRSRATTEAQKLIDQGRKLTKEKDYTKAIAAFDKAIAKDRDAARAWSGRGYAQMLAGKLVEASRDFDHAIGLDTTPEFQAPVYYNIGQIAEKRGKPAEARAAYERSLKLRPSPAVQKALKAVKKK